jgi:N-acetylglucosaminyl-diphospho-decaprenol L-rhamnosyltransferase
MIPTNETNNTTQTNNTTRTNNTLGIVIVTYNSGPEVLACIDSIPLATGVHQTQILIVDNHSLDGIPAAIRCSYPQVDVIELSSNRGFASAANVGLRALQTEFVVVLNPDTVARPNSLATLVDFAQHNKRAGIIAPLLVYPNGENQNTARSFPTAAAGLFGRRSPLTRMFPSNRWSTAFLTGRTTVATDSPTKSDWVSGACMLIPQSIASETGLFDERYFLFWEDADWCKRMHAYGYEVWTVPLATVEHAEGVSRKGWPAPIIRHFHRGAYLFWRSHRAPQWWNPLRWSAAVALFCRASILCAVQVAAPTTHKTKSRVEVLA